MANNQRTKSSNLRRHRTTLRLNDEQYHQLKTMAGKGKMSDVLIKGLAAEWEYHQNVQSVVQKLPKFKSPEELAKWTAVKFKSSPELMAKYSSATAIREYANVNAKKHQLYQLLINEFDTTNYLIRAIGNNLNQLARHANSGGKVDRQELVEITKTMMKLTNIVDDIKKEVTQ